MGTSRFIGKAYLERYAPPGGAAATTVTVNGAHVSFGQLTGGTLYLLGYTPTSADVFEVTYRDVYVENMLRQAVAELFKRNEQGVWYDPSDLSTLWQDSTGATPVSAPEQPVGLMLDKRLGTTPGPELISAQWTETPASWYVGANIAASLSNVGGEAQFTGAGTMVSSQANWFASWVNPVVIGEAYALEFDATHVSGGGVFYAGASYTIHKSITAAENAGVKTRYRMLVLAGAFAFGYGMPTFAASSGSVWKISGATLKRVRGNHAIQPTAAARPVLSALSNLLTGTDAPGSNANWTVKVDTNWTPNAYRAPNGVYLSHCAPKNNIEWKGAYHFTNGHTAGNLWSSVFCKQGELRYVQLAEGAASTLGKCVFDTQTGVFTENSLGLLTHVTAYADGVYRIAVRLIGFSGGPRHLGFSAHDGPTTISASGTKMVGDGVSGLYIGGAQSTRCSPTSLAPPPYQRVGSRNLLLKTDDFADPLWAALLTKRVTPQAITGLRGPVSVAAKVEDLSGSYEGIAQSCVVTAGTPHVISYWLVKTTGVLTSYPLLQVVRGTGASTYVAIIVDTTLGTGTVFLNAQAAAPTALTVTSDGDFWRVSIFTTPTVATITAQVYPAGSLDGTTINAAATGSTHVGAIQVEASSLATDYQKVDVAANNYDWNHPHYLKFDGSDDFMYTPANLDLSGTDKAQLFCAAEKRGAAVQVLAETSANVDTNPGAFAIAPDAVVADSWYISTGPVATPNTQSSGRRGGYTSPSRNVLTATYDRTLSGAAQIALRIDSTPLGLTPTYSNGTPSNFVSYPLYIGSRNGTGLFFNGNLYELVIRGAGSTVSQVATVERHLATKSGVTLT